MCNRILGYCCSNIPCFHCVASPEKPCVRQHTKLKCLLNVTINLIIKEKQLLEIGSLAYRGFKKFGQVPKENLSTTVALYKTVCIDSYTSADEDSNLLTIDRMPKINISTTSQVKSEFISNITSPTLYFSLAFSFPRSLRTLSANNILCWFWKPSKMQTAVTSRKQHTKVTLKTNFDSHWSTLKYATSTMNHCQTNKCPL